MTKDLPTLEHVSTVKERHLAIYCISLCSALLAKGLALAPGYALDDYAGTYVDQSIAFYLSQGRFTQAGLQWFLTLTGLSTTDVSWTAAALSLLALAALAGFIASRLDQPKTSLLYPATWAAIICSFPYFTEYFTFRQSLYNCSFYLILTFVHLALIERINGSKAILSNENRSKFLIATLLLLLAIGSHQITVAIAASASLSIAFASDVFRKGTIREQINISVRALAPSFVALVSYVVIFEIIKHLDHATVDARGDLLGMRDVPRRALLVLETLYKVFFLNEATYSSVAKFLGIVGLIPLVIVAMRKRPFSTAIWMAGLAGMIGLAILPLAASGVWWPVPRSMSAIGFVLGAMGGALCAIANIRHRAFVVPWAIASLVMAFNSSAMLRQQNRLNRWDLNRAQLIVHDIQSRYGSNMLPPVVIVGGTWSYPVPLSTTTGDLNISALAVDWAKTGLLREASGVNIVVVNSNRMLDSQCATRSPWPSADGITERSGRIIVCL